MIASIGLTIMAIFSIAKMLTLYHLYVAYGGFVPGTDAANSAYSWGAGILVMAIGSLIAVHSSRDSSAKRVGGYITAIGLVIAGFAALYYGLALSSLGHP
jgi:hypothetical protein